MAAPCHLHLHLPGCPQTLALPLPSPRGFSARPGLRSRSRLRLRPVAALGPADAGDLLGRVEAFLYTVADAAVSAADPVVTAADGGTKEAAGDWLSGITNSMETVLKVRSRPPPLRVRFRASVPAAIDSGGLCRGCVSRCGCFPVPCADASPLFCFSFLNFRFGILGNCDCELTVTPTPFLRSKCNGTTTVGVLAGIY